MLTKLYAVRDAKAEAFGKPFSLLTHGEAERAFSQSVLNPESMHSKYPEDFSLYYLGQFDDNKGLVEPLTEPQLVLQGIQIRKPTQ